ncbi:MAG: polysaccharide biosynthesis/export family protein [Verrucomicrobiota bacterium]
MSLLTSAPTYPKVAVVLALVALGVVLSGCQSPEYAQTEVVKKPDPSAEAALLREGDVLRITFPGAPNLNATQQIRPDGKITLGLIGEVPAAGMTPAQLEKDLIQRYSGQLVTKEITVTVESSSFTVFVTGMVLRPGRIESHRPITALEAIMESGGFDFSRANLKDVTVIRNTRGHTEHFKLNLKRVLEGQDEDPFYLKPSDIVYVPEKFNWF